MSFPDIDPALIQIGPFAIRWYALAYIAGLMLGWAYIKCMCGRFKHAITSENVDGFLFWAIVGVIIGGRGGYVLFYNLDYYASNPMAILQVWKGGMSFHAGFLGVVVATYLYARKKKIEVMLLADLVATAAPIGLLFGRVANFINGELYGRVTDVAWGVVFPNGEEAPRHPSQRYEAALEGLLLFAILNILVRFSAVRERRGLSTGIFLIGYGLARSFVELFRQPDVQIGFLAGGSTMGQWLSAPMIVIGVGLIVYAIFKKPSVESQKEIVM
ncbi:prolipoprotein diacylglyceryl transferase [Terasakiella sp.]|uniref:prolipoprotein diacylglyceryl transferase n=1 Tax=Terasakiella sp. TaxID=2034861 RepID=UPI003AA8CD61